MLIRIILQLLKLNYKNHYYSKLTIFAEIFAIFVTLLIYAFTSKAFSGAVDEYLMSWNGSYFNYLVIGELLLLLPTYLIQQFSDYIKSSLQNRTLETALSLPSNSFKSVLTMGLIGIPRECWRFLIMLTLSITFFGLNLDLLLLLKLLFLQIIISPAFLGMGLVAVALIIRFGRGQGIVNYFCLFGGFIAGAYFPMEVLPSFFQLYGHYLSPFSTLLYYSRKLVTDSGQFNFWGEAILIITLMSVCAFVLGYKLLKFSLKNWSKDNEQIIFTRV